jgi:hypothetical protein
MPDVNNPFNLKFSEYIGQHYFRFNIVTESQLCTQCGQHQASEIHITNVEVKR